tara:strand:- start:218 stop:859 length:642 start_codon:yes stop_codon:yes gene_type:complete
MVSVVENTTRIPVNHVALIDFDAFPSMIDAINGIEIDVPSPIISNRFDCPYSSETVCSQWAGWRFPKGKQTLDGERALIYSRIRKNNLNESESDITRSARQQTVIRTTANKLVSAWTFIRLPFVGHKMTSPLTTDLTTTELFELAWVKFRTPDENIIQCRLGGAPTRIDGTSYLIGTSQNAVTVNMFLGRSNPRKPRAVDGPYASGCPVVGSQ